MRILVAYDPAGDPKNEANWRYISDEYHVRIIGQSGVGKSTLAENAALDIASTGGGFAFIDPHGDSVRSIASNILDTRLQDVAYFDPTDDTVIGLSPFEGIDPDLEIDDTKDKINVIWPDSVGPATEETFTNFSLAGFEALKRGFTIEHLHRMLLDSTYREWVFNQVKRPDLLLYFRDFNRESRTGEADRERKMTPSKNKVANLTASFMREILAHPKPFDFRRAIDEKKIILVTGRRGKIGRRRMRMYLAQVLEKIIKAAYSREDMPKWKRTPFHVFIDEAPTFVDLVDMQGLLAELRKYGIRVWFLGQTEDVLDPATIALLEGNCRTNICFNVAQADAARFAKKFSDQYPESKILSLGAGEFIMQTMNERGVMEEPHLVRGFPPPNVKDGQRRFQSALRTSRANHGLPREQIRAFVNAIFSEPVTASPAPKKDKKERKNLVLEELKGLRQDLKGKEASNGKGNSERTEPSREGSSPTR